MIKNYDQWNKDINEATGVGKLGAKSLSALKRLFKIGGDDVAKLIDNAGKSVKSAKEAAERAAKSSDMAKQTLKKIPDDPAYDAARKSANDAVKAAEDAKKVADDASKKLDDAIRSGDPDKIKQARSFAEESSKKAGGWAKNADTYARSSMDDASKRFSRGFVREEGTDFADETLNKINNAGGSTKDAAKESAAEANRLGKTAWKIIKGTVKVITWPVRGIGNFISTAVIVGVGAGVWNLIKDNKQNEAMETIKKAHKEMENKLWEEGGISYTEIDIKKTSFAEFFTLFFAGDKSALPQKDANELKVMLSGDVTVRDFYAKLMQMCFDYPEKYFPEFEKTLTNLSKFYSYMINLEKELGLENIISAIDKADGRASKALLDTFSEDGEPKVVAGNPVDYSNPNIKILVGGSEPVKVGDLIEEAKEFLLMMATLRKKITNDSIENLVSNSIDQNSIFSKEEFEYKSNEITDELRGQISKKEEVFVAIVGLVLAYNKERTPFNSVYKFDVDSLYSTSEGIEDIVDESFALDTYNQLGRIYLTLSADSREIFSQMGKESTLFGVMEYSYFGNVMKSIILLYALEKICKMILSQKEEVQTSAEFSSSEIKEYQSVINQIQRKEGVSPTVTPTGKLDDETKEAIKTYQKKLSLPETGLPGDLALPKLREYLISLVTADKK